MITEQNSEKLSALLDDALDAKEGLSLLEDIRADRELHAKLHRYHAVRSVLRSETPSLVDVDFSARVRAAIDDEPTVLSPRVVRHQFRERVTTFALAASMAALAIMVVRSVNHYSPDKASEMLASVNLSTPAVHASMEPDLREYLNMHNESAYLSGSQGLMPSVRLVSGSQGH